MFAKNITKTVDILDDDGKKVVGTVTIRKLSARSLDKAREQRQIAAAQLTSKMGPDMVKAFRDVAKEREAEAETAASSEVPEIDPDTRYASYDRDHILRAGITSWSFDEKLEDGIDDLDEPSAGMLYKEIVDLSDPPPSVTQVVEKKDKGVTPTT